MVPLCLAPLRDCQASACAMRMVSSRRCTRPPHGVLPVSATGRAPLALAAAPRRQSGGTQPQQQKRNDCLKRFWNNLRRLHFFAPSVSQMCCMVQRTFHKWKVEFFSREIFLGRRENDVQKTDPFVCDRANPEVSGTQE